MRVAKKPDCNCQGEERIERKQDHKPDDNKNVQCSDLVPGVDDTGARQQVAD
jgi:hypothetical protein